MMKNKFIAKFQFVNTIIIFPFILFSSFSFGCADRKEVEKDKRMKGAEKVVIIGQSSHLDISWFYTADEYYEKLVRDIFISALKFLKSNPENRIFFAESFWIRKFFEDETIDSQDLLSYMKEGRLIVEGGGVGTDDHLIPPTELIIRNYEGGRRWIEEKFGFKPSSDAWVPDSFGFPDSTPDLFAIMGFRSIALSRVSGFTLPSTAYIKPSDEGYFLSITEGSFVPNSAGHELWKMGQLVRWRGKQHEVIIYWMPFLYGVGSSFMCVSGLPAPIYINPNLECALGDESGGEDFAKKLMNYIKHIKPNSRFIFIPVGWDFEKPSERLTELIRYWNEKYYPETKIYVTQGSFSDFISLVINQEGKDRLPVFSGHLAPYWTGFFGSRCWIKKFMYQSVSELLSIETTIVIMKLAGINIDDLEKEIDSELRNIWFELARFSNHDAGAGTIYRRVQDKEIEPLASEIGAKIKATMEKLQMFISDKVATGKVIVINTLGFEREGIPAFGFRIIDKAETDKEEKEKIYLKPGDYFQLKGFQNIKVKVVLWLDDGGSWRIGSETPPGRFKELGEAGTTAQEGVNPDNVLIEIERNKIRFLADHIGLKFDPKDYSLSKKRDGYSLTARFTFSEKITKLMLDTHFGLSEYTERYLIYSPTFLPFRKLFQVYLESGKIITFSTKGCKGVAQTSQNSIDIFIGRNAQFEKYDILGPLGDMSEIGPFELEVMIEESGNSIEGIRASYSYHFPLLKVEGRKKDGETESLNSYFSALAVEDNIAYALRNTRNGFLVRTALLDESLKMTSSMFIDAIPQKALPDYGKISGASNTFLLKAIK